MVGRFLITTADESTWRTDIPVLFLGEWCRLYNRRAVWQKLDAEVVPYHWDDRAKFHKDYGALKDLYERLLAEVADRLNEIHHVDHSLRYWRILIGPWLGFFTTQIVFDRWEMIQNAVKRYEISGARVIEGDLLRLVPNDMADFSRLFTGDSWNQAIFGYLLEQGTQVCCERVANRVLAPATADIFGPQINMKRRFQRFIAGMVSKVLAIGVKRDEAFFIADYLSLRQSFSLQTQLGQMPRLWRAIAPASVAVNSDARRWRLKDAPGSDFERALRSLIPLQMPTIYLEGYSRLMKQVSALPWPQHPRFIFTSNSYDSDDVFKAWAAEKVEAGAPFIIGQHGGHYGLGRSYFTEEHERAISDRFLSWGWEEGGHNKIKPVGNLKMVGHRLGWDPEGYGLMVEMAMSRYSYHMFSAPVASQWLDYFEDQARFVAALPPKLREELRVRLFGQDFGWCQKQRWRNRFPKICLDDGIAPIASLIKKSRLYIATYNATTFLESLAMNIPTIIFWDPKHWELRPGAQPYFDRLKEAGIFHETPESAAAKVAEVWNDVPGWWNQPKIQEARAYFCYHFARMPEDPLSVLKEALTTAKFGGLN